jgi:hypothetical protein
VGKLLRQLHLDHRSACPLSVTTAVKAVVQGNYLKPMVHHSFNDLPHWLKEADAAITPSSFQDEDSDNPPELDGYLALVPNGLDKPNQRVPFVPCAHIIRSHLWVLLQLYPLQPLLEMFPPHAGGSYTAAIGQLRNRNPYLAIGRHVILDFSGK